MERPVDWRRLSPFGAEVRVDLSGELSGAQIACLRQLFDTHHLLIFKNQRLSGEDQMRISGWFGPTPSEKPPTYYATNDSGLGGMGDAEITFHSDLSCSPEPLLGISLHAIDVAEGASPTIFIDAVAAADILPASLRARLNGLHVMNLWPLDLAKRQRRETSPEGWPGAAHSILKAHPRTGEAILYLNASHSDRIVELPGNESESLIHTLFRYLYERAPRYEHRWANGDFIVWDNLALQHMRPASPPSVARTLQRVEIGPSSYMEHMPQEVMKAYGIG
jgi:taurine dioxygenase